MHKSCIFFYNSILLHFNFRFRYLKNDSLTFEIFKAKDMCLKANFSVNFIILGRIRDRTHLSKVLHFELVFLANFIV